MHHCLTKNSHIYTFFWVCLMGCSSSTDGELLFVEPGKDSKFEYPYFLFIPENTVQNETSYLIIEPNNSGFVDDALQKHINSAKLTATKDFYLGNYSARALGFPLLVPVFPRPETDWQIYTHDLDRDVMTQKGNSLERIDRQLIDMFEDAKTKLAAQNIKTHHQFLMTGFSASGSFANRFTAIHPERVLAVAAGGTSGLLLLPLDSLEEEALNYPIGTNDLEVLTGKAFQKAAFLTTPQFYFVGGLDTNDAAPYEDAFSKAEREQIYRLLGKEMQPERWENCKNIYHNQNVKAIIKTYEHIAHEHPAVVKAEIVDFFKKNISEN